MITLDEYLASKGPEFRKEVDKQYSEMAMEYSLSRLREELQMSQKELANNLNISQPAVCKIEKNAEDVKLSTLIKYVNALGGHLSLVIHDGEIRAQSEGLAMLNWLYLFRSRGGLSRSEVCGEM